MLLPVLALRNVDNLTSDPEDFMFLGMLMTGVALGYELAARVPARLAYRAAIGVAVVNTLLSVWINLAVGIIGSEDNPANLLFAAAPAVALAGALLARFRPRGMASAMVGAAFAQGMIFAVALIAGWGFAGPITVFFAAHWLVAAWLFGKSAATQAQV